MYKSQNNGSDHQVLHTEERMDLDVCHRRGAACRKDG